MSIQKELVKNSIYKKTIFAIAFLCIQNVLCASSASLEAGGLSSVKPKSMSIVRTGNGKKKVIQTTVYFSSKNPKYELAEENCDGKYTYCFKKELRGDDGTYACISKLTKDKLDQTMLKSFLEAQKKGMSLLKDLNPELTKLTWLNRLCCHSQLENYRRGFDIDENGTVTEKSE